MNVNSISPHQHHQHHHHHLPLLPTLVLCASMACISSAWPVWKPPHDHCHCRRNQL